ncbi:hypothetical protein BC830DRAFT_1051978, partial [Chytriomyces sp. MP71]
VPTAPKVLGLAGLLPFLGTAALSFTNPETVWLMMEIQAVYSTTILSFMGAVHWGLAMAENSTESKALRYALSTAPALIAFFSAVLGNVPTSLAVHLVGYNALLVGDIIATKRGLAPSWYPGLRVYLTGVVSASIASILCLGY